MTTREEKRRALLELSHDLGAEDRDLAILGEGNTSARLGDETFIVKASGSSLGTLGEADVVECRFAPLLMAVKAAHIFAGSVPLGGPVFLTAEQIASIAGRRDEHYRQRALNL